MFKLYSPSFIQFLCQKYQFRPVKRMGQNFLIDQNILAKIVEAAELSKKDIVLEIGPGFGVLTGKLAQIVKKVVAVEKDKQLSQILEQDIFPGIKNIEIINQDILKYHAPADFKKYKVVANLPYYISKPVIQKFISSPACDNHCSLLVLLLQKEVAKKICAKPPDMNLLALSAQFYARPQIISYVSQNSFWPKPKVDSAILKIAPNQKDDYSFTSSHYQGEGGVGLKFDLFKSLPPPASPFAIGRKCIFKHFEDLFFQLAKAGFSHKRKKLISNLNHWLNRCNGFQSSGRPVSINIEKTLALLGFKNTVRAQELGVEDWLRLTLYLNELM